MMDCTVLGIDEMERAFGGVFVRVRASLGVSGFGVQVIELPPNSGDAAPEHDHLHDDQEEVYLLLDGGGEIEVDGEHHPLARDVFVRVGPGARRRLRSGPEGMRVLAMGGMPGRPYAIQANSELGGPEELFATAKSSMIGADDT
jgi:mannose-6-phosphate isomerase-like protein (cupin superfamily)